MSPVESVTVQPLHCGSLTAAWSMFEDGGAADDVTIPVPTWLIRHPQGTVLFDTGMHPDLTGPSEKLDGVSLFFAVDLDADSLVDAKLETIDTDAGDIDFVVLSHLHFDHVGGLARIPNATVVVQQDEWVHGTEPELAAASTYSPDEYQLGHDVRTIDGEHDLFGDGSVTCIPTPGHTAGHQSMRVRTANHDLVLAADCLYFSHTLDGGALPPFGFDREQHEASRRHLQSLSDAGSTVIPGHDQSAFAALPALLD